MELVGIVEAGVVVNQNEQISTVPWQELQPGHPIIKSLQCFMLGMLAGRYQTSCMLKSIDGVERGVILA